MSGHSFTPGPWMVRTYDGSPVIDSADGWCVALCHNDCGPGGATPANARLISAAPDLLAALEAALWMIEKHEGTCPENDAIYDAARAAIAKAVQS